ncbi:MAG TPA: hypothetical protein VNS63_12055 [Blastocatellia bacterium]|nr:hypothetical protein [Blastocatellia bacterium]
MSTRLVLKCCATLVLSAAVVSSGLVYGLQKPGDEKGESAASKKLKNRRTPPTQADIDKTLTLAGLLDKKAKSDWSETKAAVIEGYVVQIEKEDDGDIHIVLADDRQESDTNKWMIVEVTSAWRKRKTSLSDARLRQLHNKKIRVTGWLFYEPEEEHADPRGTRWELHPVTDVSVVQ